MYTQNNPYYPAHDFPRNWSADELADAVAESNDDDGVAQILEQLF